jgi:hypothetical protein
LLAEEAWTANQTIHQINQSASLQIDRSSQKVIEIEAQAEKIIIDQAEAAYAEKRRTENVEALANQFVAQAQIENNNKASEIESLRIALHDSTARLERLKA